MGPELGDPTMLDHGYEVGRFNGGQTMGDRDARPASPRLVQRFLNGLK